MYDLEAPDLAAKYADLMHQANNNGELNDRATLLGAGAEAGAGEEQEQEQEEKQEEEKQEQEQRCTLLLQPVVSQPLDDDGLRTGSPSHEADAAMGRGVPSQISG